MKLLVFALFLISSCLYFVKCFPDLEIKFMDYNPRELIQQFPGYGKSWMYFPDGNGIPQIAQLNVTTFDSKLFFPFHKHIEFHLYTRSNPHASQILHLDNTTLTNSNYNSSNPTKFMAHGWTSKHTSDTSQTIKNNFLEAEDCNMILINWEQIASNIVYPIPARDTKNVGNHVGEMVDFLVENGARLEDMHLIGHSLGAHVVGNAGSAVKSGKVGRITGLDPALPGFEIVASDDTKLDSSDAEFVDVIHTCGGILGYYSKLGHADFYPNGGVPSQPGCFGLPQLIEGCSHGRAWQYFAESLKLKDGFMSTECETWEKYVHGKCENNTQVAMGISTPHVARGVFYLKTLKKPPFVMDFDIFSLINNTEIRKAKGILPFNLFG